MTRYVGVDLHRRRSVIVVLDADGTELWTRRIDNDPLTLGLEIEEAGPDPEVVLEATWGWYWAADVIAGAGGRVHLAHPLGIKGFENRRVKNDQVDARLLADLLRMGRLPESWIAPEGVRHQRELVRYRRKLSQLRAGLKAQVHAVLGKEGLRAPINHLWGPGGTVWLDETGMAEVYETRVRSLRRLISVYDTEITQLDSTIVRLFKDHQGYETIQQLNGVGPVLAAIFSAELGDVTRFSSAKRVCSWAGLTPRHRESDTTIHRGPITKQGSGLVRWAAIEAISRNHGDDPIRTHYRRVAERRGLNKGRVAAARKLLTLVYYGLRDGEIRSLAAQTT
jgi:transposase